MRVDVSFYGRTVLFNFTPDAADVTLLSDSVHMSARSCFFELPEQISEERIHPDLLALSIVLCGYPYIQSKLEIDFSVSRGFAELCFHCLGIVIENASDEVGARTVKDGRPGLAFSGGVDSTAALVLMPENTVCAFIDRVSPAFKKTLYNKTAAHNAVKEVSAIRKGVYSCPSNMEHMRSKVGFPVDSLNSDINFASGVPLVLLADIFRIDAIGYGAILETIYGIGHDKYDDYASSEHYQKWSPLFDFVGCSLFLAVAGISEVGTSLVVKKSGFSDQIRSCMRGDGSSACRKCIKCFRKLNLDKALERAAIDDEELVSNLNSREVVSNLFGKIKHENVYRYMVNYAGYNRVLNALACRISIADEDVVWMERWYQKALNLVPEKYRSFLEQRISSFLEPMSETDVSFLEGWDSRKQNSDPGSLLQWRKVLSAELLDPSVKGYFQTLEDQSLSAAKSLKGSVSYSAWLRLKGILR